ncbi:hypothetical protein [Anaerosolibacter sp.]|uniref:hypothetical protein n=1 Tax=Anaerosolibacter sp. TaxID=1872527 RepID=UPI0039EED746
MPKAKDYAGLKLGNLVALEPTDTRKDGRIAWRFECLNCGNKNYLSPPKVVISNHRKSGVAEEKVKPSKPISQLPVFRSFLVNENQSSRSLDYLYGLRDKLTDEKGSKKVQNKMFVKSDQLKYINKEVERIGEISKELRAITNAVDLNKKQKAEQIRRLIDERNRIARNAEEYIRKKWGD